MSTFEFLVDGQIVGSIRRKAETYAVAEMAWRMSMPVSQFKKIAQVRMSTKAGKTQWNIIW